MTSDIGPVPATMAGMGRSLVIAGSIGAVIAVVTIIPAAIILAITYWLVAKPKYDAGRAFGLVVLACFVVFILLAIWIGTA